MGHVPLSVSFSLAGEFYISWVSMTYTCVPIINIFLSFLISISHFPPFILFNFILSLWSVLMNDDTMWHASPSDQDENFWIIFFSDPKPASFPMIQKSTGSLGKSWLDGPWVYWGDIPTSTGFPFGRRWGRERKFKPPKA